MSKKNVMITLEEETHKRAKENLLNISQITEKTLREKLSNKINADEEELRCNFCGIHLPKQTADDLTKGLCWLCPDEIWVCPRCLKAKIRKSTIAVATRYK